MKLYLGRLEVLSSWAQVSLGFLYVQCTLPTTKLPLSKALCSGRGGGIGSGTTLLRFQSWPLNFLAGGGGLGKAIYQFEASLFSPVKWN